jgi:hypothetical protein
MRLAAALVAASFLAFAAPAAAQSRAPSIQDLWWAGPEESGWGLSVVQHGERVFAVLFVYEETAHTTWFVMPSGSWDASSRRFTGPLYWPRGANLDAYDAGALRVGEPFGSATLTVEDDGSLGLEYAAGAHRGSKRLVRQPFAAGAQGALTDMWWGGFAQNGWGVALFERGETLFSVWFTYFDGHVRNADPGRAAWFVMPGGRWTSPATYEGRIYRPFGARWLGVAFETSKLAYPEIGTYRFTLEGERIVFESAFLGLANSLVLTRQPF